MGVPDVIILLFKLRGGDLWAEWLFFSLVALSAVELRSCSFGFAIASDATYDKWVYHCERVQDDINDYDQFKEDEFEEPTDYNSYSNEDEFEKLLGDIYRGTFLVNENDEEIFDSRRHIRFEKMLDLLEKDLYQGCKKYSTLSFVIKLLHLKVLNHWTNKSLDMLLELLRDILPDDAKIPKSYYEAKTMLREIGIGYESIDACK